MLDFGEMGLGVVAQCEGGWRWIATTAVRYQVISASVSCCRVGGPCFTCRGMVAGMVAGMDCGEGRECCSMLHGAVHGEKDEKESTEQRAAEGEGCTSPVQRRAAA